MSIGQSCCTLPPVDSNYQPQGSEWKLGDLTIYETTDKTPTRLLICAYDIFGLHPNTKQFCDRLGQSGFRVAMPDFFHGQPYPMEAFPPKDRAELYSFIRASGSWDTTVKSDLEKVLEHYKTKEKVTNFGMFGFCWGAKVTCHASSEIDDIKASGIIHPTLVELKDADSIKCPMILLPSKDEEDMNPFYNKLQERLGNTCKHVRFDDMFHGFASARADLENELNRKRVNDVLQLLHSFFSKHV